MSRPLVLRPPAKINLTLRVGPVRLDGYHEVRTLLQSLALSDTLALTPRRGPLALDVRGPGAPADRDNLVWRAATTFWHALGRSGDPRDVHVRLDKQIPAAAGLGGGSTDAAAALAGLNVIWDARWPRHALMDVAASLGADVPFFLHGGTALGVGRGEEVYPVDDIGRLGVVIVKPSWGVATAEAYQWHDEDRDAGINAPLRAPKQMDVGWPGGPIRLVNDLEGPVSRRHPEIVTMIDACERAGVLGAAMTGSGAAVFALVPEASARRVMARLTRPEWLVLLTRTLTRREASRRMGL
jgi:4-diphosphocytidyl-2-C-methyl-D-erythritol kinase